MVIAVLLAWTAEVTSGHLVTAMSRSLLLDQTSHPVRHTIRLSYDSSGAAAEHARNYGEEETPGECDAPGWNIHWHVDVGAEVL